MNQVTCPYCKFQQKTTNVLFLIIRCDECNTPFFIESGLSETDSGLCHCNLCRSEIDPESPFYRWKESYGWQFLCEECLNTWKHNYPNFTLTGFIETAQLVRLGEE